MGVTAKKRKENANASYKQHREELENNNQSKKKKTTYSNKKCSHKTVEDEDKENQIIWEEQLKFFKCYLVIMMRRLSKVKDFRNPKKRTHRLACIFLFGLLLFVYQYASRREGTRELTRPQLLENLRYLFPELETMPHGDTVNNVLKKIDVEQIQDEMVQLIRKLIKKKKFLRFLVDMNYLVAIDGLNAYSRDYNWNDHCVKKTYTTSNGEKTVYFLYIVEAYLVFPNGLRIPLYSEFLDNAIGDNLENKQDCETKACKRLLAKLKKEFPRLKITVLLDGLYATGPLIRQLNSYHWGYMITLKKDKLRSVWEEYYALIDLEKTNEVKNTWHDRSQTLRWVNGIDYRYGNNGKNQLLLNVVTCVETYMVVDKETGLLKPQTDFYAWLSSKKITKKNVATRCNLMGRCRWSVEEGILVEKKHGYNLEHMFSADWNAMKGFYYLMRVAHLLNNLFTHSIFILEILKETSQGMLFNTLREYLSNKKVDTERTVNIINKERVHIYMV